MGIEIGTYCVLLLNDGNNGDDIFRCIAALSWDGNLSNWHAQTTERAFNC